MTGEDAENRLKRLRLRSWRRGIREMDLILGGWADARLAGLDGSDLDLYEALLAENDHDLYGWITGRETAPERFSALVTRISAEHLPSQRD